MTTVYNKNTKPRCGNTAKAEYFIKDFFFAYFMGKKKIQRKNKTRSIKIITVKQKSCRYIIFYITYQQHENQLTVAVTVNKSCWIFVICLQFIDFSCQSKAINKSSVYNAQKGVID